MSANDIQHGGTHYQKAADGYQHWDFVYDTALDYYRAQATRYLCRWRHKNGIVDLNKSKHFIEKLIELGERNPTSEDGYPFRIHGEAKLRYILQFCNAYELSAYERLIVMTMMRATDTTLLAVALAAYEPLIKAASEGKEMASISIMPKRKEELVANWNEAQK